jgi:hypothetical protein
MSKNDGEREFRLLPRKPRVSQSTQDRTGWTAGFKMLMHYARRSRSSPGGGSPRPSRPHHQRCAVRITYSRNTTRGQWRAHGRYLERESAAGGTSGFDARETEIPISTSLQSWQSQKDELLWKFIISPPLRTSPKVGRITTPRPRVSDNNAASKREAYLNGLEFVSVAIRNVTDRRSGRKRRACSALKQASPHEAL